MHEGADRGHPISARQYQEKLAKSMSFRYLIEQSVRVCELQSVREHFAAAGFRDLCPDQKSKYQIQCYKDWTSRQNVAYSSEIPLLAVVASDVALKDRAVLGNDHAVILAVLIDSILIPMEKFETAKNGALNSPKSTVHAVQVESESLQKTENYLFIKAKTDLLKVVEAKLRLLKDSSARQVQVSAPARKWTDQAVLSLEKRIARLKAGAGAP